MAVSIIVGYINVSRCSLQDFLDMWQEHAPIREAKTPDDIDAALDLLWGIGIKEVAWNARRLLEILAFFDHKGIPRSLLSGQHTEEYLRFLNTSETIR